MNPHAGLKLPDEKHKFEAGIGDQPSCQRLQNAP